MITFQLDQNINDEDLALHCEREGRDTVKVFRFPKSFSKDKAGVKDPVVLRHFFERGTPIVTCDRKIAEEHCGVIPNRHPGIVIISYAPGQPKTMTTAGAKRILSSFKAGFQSWAETIVQNSIIKITQMYVEIFHTQDGKLINDAIVDFSEQDWPKKIKELLRKNSESEPSQLQ